ncbi:MerR family transcriptional regulator [Streptomyces sp. NPDC051940]|uniref:MerR family transcriptional regulator n=1 Tax=Streptomyces sp. NPDC051940 TaxID=3155675 RepID=UPI003415A8A5
MNDDDRRLLTIGQLARRTGLPVRTIRYWSDIGAVPPAGRSAAGYRLYDAEAAARLDLVRTLRELGLGLEDVRRVLARERTVADVAAAHVRALDARIRALRLNRAVLSTVARRSSDTEELTLMNRLARLSAAERRQIIEDFVAEVHGGLEADPQLREKMRHLAPDLPDDPTPEQADAWLELAELVRDPEFRQRVRRMLEHHAASRVAAGPEQPPGAFRFFAKKVELVVAPARERGVRPGGPEAAAVLDELLGEGTPAGREAVLRRLEAGRDAEMERFQQLIAVINGHEPGPSRTPDHDWLIEALRAEGAQPG